MAENIICPSCSHVWQAIETGIGLQQCPACNADIEVTRQPATWRYNTEVAGLVIGYSTANIECPAKAQLGLRRCEACGIAIEVTRRTAVWQYEAVQVSVVKADDDT